MTTKLFTFATASAIACALTISPAWANPEGGYGGHGGGYEKGQHGMGAAMMEMMMHGGAGHHLDIAGRIVGMPCTDRVGELHYISDRRTQREMAQSHCREDHFPADGLVARRAGRSIYGERPHRRPRAVTRVDRTLIALN